MKKNLVRLSIIIFVSVILAGCTTTRSGTDRSDTNTSTTGSVTSLTSDSRRETTRSGSICGLALSPLWIEGRVDLVAGESTMGLIAVEKIEVYWIPYFEHSIPLELHDIVFFRIQAECINNFSDTITIATQVTRNRPASDICSEGCIDDRWLNGRTIVPHGMFEHPGGGTMHKPGHIIDVTTTTKTLKVMEGSTLLQSEEYTLVRIQYETTADTEDVYVPTKFIDELNQSTTNYFLEFYEDTIDGFKVLRSFSADHTHPGHISNITIIE